MSDTTTTGAQWYSALADDELFLKFKDCFTDVENVDEACSLSIEDLITMGVARQSARALYIKFQSLESNNRPGRPIVSIAENLVRHPTSTVRMDPHAELRSTDELARMTNAELEKLYNSGITVNACKDNKIGANVTGSIEAFATGGTLHL